MRRCTQEQISAALKVEPADVSAACLVIAEAAGRLIDGSQFTVASREDGVIFDTSTTSPDK